MHRHHGIDLWDAWERMPWRKLEPLIARLPREWGYAEENSARLYEALNFWLDSEYSNWTTDHDDPAYLAEQARRKREGIKPPPRPLITPVALRPEPVAQARLTSFLDAVKTAVPEPSPDPTRFLSSDEFDLMFSL